MLMRIYHVRFTDQIETADAVAVVTEVILFRSGRLRVLIDVALREFRERVVGLLFFG